MKRQFRFILFIFLSFTATGLGITITGPDSYIPALNATDGDDLVILNPASITPLTGASQMLKDILQADFPTWDFAYVPGLNGTLHIFNYEATTERDDNGGALLRATYTRSATDPSIPVLHWIQLITTNDPDGDGTEAESYLDNRLSTELPIYSGEESSGQKTETTFSFLDEPNRNARTDPDFIRWRAELMLASWDGSIPGHVTVYDGLLWGFDLHDFAVPEPGTLGCMAFGFGVLAVLRSARIPRA